MVVLIIVVVAALLDHAAGVEVVVVVTLVTLKLNGKQRAKMGVCAIARSNVAFVDAKG